MAIVSVVVILGGAAGVFLQGGFNLGIDFEAGLRQRVQVLPSAAEADTATVRDALGEIGDVQVQEIGNPADQEFTIRVQDDGTIDDFSQVMSERIATLLEEEFGASAVEILSTDYVGPRFSQDLTRQTVFLTSLALALILIYIWFRFRLAYAVAAIVTLLHDVAIMLGFIGTFQIEVATATIAAVLTIIGYSLNDTIVIFDRIRENETLLRDSEFGIIVNTSITQSLSRTLITSLTTMLAVVAIFIFATGTIQDFALNLMVGIVVGTYSSIFVASPFLLSWQRRARQRARQKDVKQYGAKPPAQKKVAADQGEGKAEPKKEGEKQAAAVGSQDVESVKREIERKRAAAAAGKNQPRSKRKKKK
jgi:preprotein translocase subunit SecF